MTAYELAKQLEERHAPYEDDAANMLRKQADRIAELEKKGEPVAWMEYIQDEEWEVWYTEPTDLPEGHSYKPLYLAPQTKPLSDEEIYKLWCEADNTELLPEMRLKDGSINYIITTFARLIEERHGIK